MAKGKDKWVWGFVSHILAKVHNSNLWDEKAKPLSPDVFNPYSAKPKDGGNILVSDFSFMQQFCKEDE